MTEDTSPENLRKFLESNDPAMVRMGLSMAKGGGVPEELLGLVAGLYMWHDDKTVRAAARSVFMAKAPEDSKKAVKDTWKTSYRTLNTDASLQPKVVAMLRRFKNTPLDSIDLWKTALDRDFPASEGYYSLPPPWHCSIVYALSTFQTARAVEPLIKSLGNKCWSNSDYWEDDGSHTIYDAVKALGKIGEPAVEPLIKVLEVRGDDDLTRLRRGVAAEILGKIGDTRAVEPLIIALADGSGMVRVAAVAALDKLKWKPDTDELRITYLFAENNWESLVECGGPAVEPLIEALSDTTYDSHSGQRVCVYAINALGEIGDARAVEPLIKVLEDGGYDVRQNSARALGEIGDVRAVEALIRVLEDEDSKVRQNSARALGEIGDGRAVGPLIKALNDELAHHQDIYLHQRASPHIAYALGEIGDTRAVESLIELLGGESTGARDEAAKALGKIGDKRAVEPLITVLNDVRMSSQRMANNVNISLWAKEALKKLGHEVK